VVEDSDAVRRLAPATVRYLGFDVVTAADGTEALDVFRDRGDELDCVLLDLRMPAMDGERVLDELRRHSIDVPVILCTGFASRDLTQRLTAKGVAGFVEKPYSVAEIQRLLRSVLEG